MCDKISKTIVFLTIFGLLTIITGNTTFAQNEGNIIHFFLTFTHNSHSITWA